MAIKLRRGLEEERQVILFEQGEIVYATDSKKVYIGDGLTVGGNLVTGEELLSKLDDVVLTALSNGNLLIYDSTLQKWKNIAPTTDNIPEGANLYYTLQRFDDQLATKSTTNLAEGTNLYYTNDRFDTRLATKSTTNLTEGTNLYYTDTRFDDRLATKFTTNLAEGTNLYFTNTRVYTKVKASLIAGSNTSITFDDALQTITIASQGNVQSVNGETGEVVLDTDDIGQGVNNLYYTDARFDDRLATKTTDDLTEGANEYYTDAKVDSVLVAEDVTKQGNTFNGAEQLVQLDATAKLPAVDGSNLTNLPIPLPPTLQEVTNEGANTTNDIEVNGIHINGDFSNYNKNILDIGAIQTSDARGYGRDYIGEKTLAYCRIGASAFDEEGAVRIKNGVFQTYIDGAWQDVVTNFRFREDGNGQYELEHKPVGFSWWIEVNSGNSDIKGLNGLPIVQNYAVSMGAYPVPLELDGGTF